MKARDILNNTDPNELRNIVRRLMLRQSASQVPPLVEVVQELPAAYPLTEIPSVEISSDDANITAVNFLEQTTAPDAPGADHRVLYAKADGLYQKDSADSESKLQVQDDLLDSLAALADPDADRILFWDDSEGAFKWLTVGTNLTITGTTIEASGGGSSSAGGHLHGLARWVADGSLAAFELPDVAEYLDVITDDGVAVDALLYSLSSDQTQLVFDSAPTVAHVIQAHYVIASL